MGDRRKARKLRGKVLSSCVTRVCINALETMALTETIEVGQGLIKLKNLVRIIVGVKRVDKRRMDEMRVEIGVKESVKTKVEGST